VAASAIIKDLAKTSQNKPQNKPKQAKTSQNKPKQKGISITLFD